MVSFHGEISVNLGLGQFNLDLCVQFAPDRSTVDEHARASVCLNGSAEIFAGESLSLARYTLGVQAMQPRPCHARIVSDTNVQEVTPDTLRQTWIPFMNNMGLDRHVSKRMLRKGVPRR